MVPPSSPPQELDDEFLICWEDYTRAPLYKQVPWQYVTRQGLYLFLMARAREGYAFPMNPKWALCDGWYPLLEVLLASDGAKDACDAWYPRGSGVRKRMATIHAAHPNGFRPDVPEGEEPPPSMSVEEAEWAFRRHQHLRSAKKKLRAFAAMQSLFREKKMRRSFKRAFTAHRFTDASFKRAI